MIEHDDYVAWLETPVTRWFFAAFRNVADQNEALAKEHAWQSAIAGQSNQIDTHQMTVLAEKAKAYRAVFEADYSDIRHFNGEED